jgi:protein-disulfide isomerase
MRSLALLLVIATGCAHEGAAPSAAPSLTSASRVAAKIGEQVITLDEVDAAAGHELFELRSSALDRIINERVIEAAAHQANRSADDLLHDLAGAKVAPITDAEAEQFFESNHDRLPEQLASKSFAELKPLLLRALGEQKRAEATAAVVEDLRKKAGVQVLFEEPKVKVAATGPSRGPANARVTIIEFSDFQCPYCARGRQVMDQVLAAYDKDVRLVYRDFPLSFHEQAEKAAEAGRCADEQSKFWAMHDWMFDNQRSLSVPELKQAAQSLELDVAKFSECLDSGRYQQAVKSDAQAGEKAGVRGTPAYFLNGRFLNGAQPLEKVKAEVDRALKEM